MRVTKVLSRESNRCSASRVGEEEVVGKKGRRYSKRVVIRASRVVIVSRRVVREDVGSRNPDEVSVSPSVVAGSVLISSSAEYG